MDRNSVSWTGYIPAITTPFTAIGELDLASFAAQMRWYADRRMHGVILAGTSGEWFSMSANERADLFAEGGMHRTDEFVVIGACNAFTAKEAIEHAEAAEWARLDGLLLTPPPYIVPNRREIVDFYRAVSDATTLPICVYNWPRGCNVDLDLATLEELAAIDNVVAVKNSTGDFGAFLTAMYALEGTIRYFGLPTSELGTDLALAGHGDGLMGSGGVLGADHSNFWRAIAAGDRAKAVELGRRDRVLMEDWFTPDYGVRFGNQQAIMKTALRLQGVPAGYVRKPLLELTDEEVAQIAMTLGPLAIETTRLP